jgi:hypothetical protein
MAKYGKPRLSCALVANGTASCIYLDPGIRTVNFFF